MAVRTSVLIVALLATVAHADDDTAIVGQPDGWKVEDLRFRFAFFDQRGHGYQAQGAPPGEPGSEWETIFQPMIGMTIRQNDRVTHEVTIPVDIVTAASPDAVDAIATASRVNEAGGLDVKTTIKLDDVTTILTRVGFHIEEPISSGHLGAGWRRSLADDNAAIQLTTNLTVDGMDVRDDLGVYLRKDFRLTWNVNAAFSQLLSPTTIFDGNYGLTAQAGELATSWNAVPIAASGAFITEMLPRSRVRQAVAARVSQIVPTTHTTLKVWYRYYTDDFDIHAHTVELDAYQYLAPWLYVRGSWRWYTQTGASFYTQGLPSSMSSMSPRTADSDLGPFHANELGASLVFLGPAAPWRWARSTTLSADYLRYVRSNDLTMDVISIAYGHSF